jgi:hypothetical protein
MRAAATRPEASIGGGSADEIAEPDLLLSKEAGKPHPQRLAFAVTSGVVGLLGLGHMFTPLVT